MPQVVAMQRAEGMSFHYILQTQMADILTLKINETDNVAVAVGADLHAGETHRGVTLLNDVPCGHKFALRTIAEGEKIIKYGFPIGHSTKAIEAGEWIHTHNLATSLGENERYEYNPSARIVSSMIPVECREVNGYLRGDGRMGIRNELWIVPTVGCVNGQANAIAARVSKECDLQGIDDVRAFTHNYGCSQLGSDHEMTRAALAALATHPNAGGVLVLGLGCENNQIAALREQMGGFDEERVKFLVAQDVEDEIETGFRLCRGLVERMKTDRRTPQPLSKLKVGLKCGGSDGLSGITANPLVGLFSDWLTGCGGTTVLTEVPEMFGAETILMDRASDQEVFIKIVDLINGFKEYFRSYGQPVYENPSPGNKAGGITTLEEKSLGCVQKGGTSEVVDVLDYAVRAVRPGLNLLRAPGNDLVASTALALSGCQMVLFTTGRGTPFGTFVPTLKISTNTPLASRKPHWIDFNAGEIVNGASIESMLEDLIEKVIFTVEGTPLNHELAGAKEIAIFKQGVTL